MANLFPASREVLCLPHVCSKEKEGHFVAFFFFGADYETRPRHLHLGKVALYRMS